VTRRTVTTQTELDTALADGIDYIDITSPAGVVLYLSRSGSATVTASDSATVTASGSATVRASGSATVRASGSATVTAPHRTSHLCPTPHQAADYYTAATRFLACIVNPGDVSPILGSVAKCKVRALTVSHEVDIHGRRIDTQAVTP